MALRREGRNRLTIEVHPLFADENKTELDEPIAFIDVRRFFPNGKNPMIAVVPAEELGDEIALRERYGPGTYILVGRNANRSRILRRATVDVEDERAATPPAEPAAAAPSPTPPAAAQGNELVALIIKQQLEDARVAREEAREAHKATITAITELAGARLADQRDMLQALSKQRAEGGDAKQYEKGLELGLSLAQVMAEGNEKGGVEEIVKGFAQGMQAMRDLQNGGPPNGGAS